MKSNSYNNKVFMKDHHHQICNYNFVFFLFFFVVVAIGLLGDVIRDPIIANEFLFMESIPFLEHPLDDYHLFLFFSLNPPGFSLEVFSHFVHPSVGR